jgi:L-arabinose isomerase
MPEISRFFGIIVRMFYNEHNPAHIHAEYASGKAVFDLQGNILKGDLQSKTATRLVREWIDLYAQDIARDWELARRGDPLEKIPPLQ